MVVCEVPEIPPPTAPVVTFNGVGQVYTVPTGTFVGMALKVELLQILVVILFTTGIGFTTMVTT